MAASSVANNRTVHNVRNIVVGDCSQDNRVSGTVVLVGGPGTGKTHLATAIGVAGITRHGKRVRFYYTVDLVNLTRKFHLPP
jgi:DNA replication protein DnaC